MGKMITVDLAKVLINETLNYKRRNKRVGLEPARDVCTLITFMMNEFRYTDEYKNIMRDLLLDRFNGKEFKPVKARVFIDTCTIGMAKFSTMAAIGDKFVKPLDYKFYEKLKECPSSTMLISVMSKTFKVFGIGPCGVGVDLTTSSFYVDLIVHNESNIFETAREALLHIKEYIGYMVNAGIILEGRSIMTAVNEGVIRKSSLKREVLAGVLTATINQLIPEYAIECVRDTSYSSTQCKSIYTTKIVK